MKTNKTFRLVMMIIPLLAFGVSACAGGKPHQDKNISYWTCPMHPQIHKDEKGPCPICGMDLVPVYKNAKPSAGVTITPDQQKRIGLQRATVKSQPLTRLISASGRVAFDPELAVAIREYRQAAANVPSLKSAARSRLKLMGLSEEDIRDLARTTESSLYLPTSQSATWVYATLFTGDVTNLKSGSAVTVELPDGSLSASGVLKSLTPVVDATTRTITARIELKPEAALRPGTFVNVTLSEDLGSPLSIPKSAMVNTGKRKLAFMIHENDQFMPVEIRTGPETEDRIVITGGLKEGDAVVAAATFFVDSETQLKGVGVSHD